MGDRAMIATKAKDICVYLHWHGARDLVEPLLEYCSLHGYRSPDRDDYGWARMCQVMGNFIGGGLSIGVAPYDHYEIPFLDNGVYIIEDWKIVDRIVSKSYEERCEYPRERVLHAYDDAMPPRERLGEYLDSVEVDTASLHVDDMVWVKVPSGRFCCFPVQGFKVPSDSPEDEATEPYVRFQWHDLSGGECTYERFIRTDRARIRPRK